MSMYVYLLHSIVLFKVIALVATVYIIIEFVEHICNNYIDWY